MLGEPTGSRCSTLAWAKGGFSEAVDYPFTVRLVGCAVHLFGDSGCRFRRDVPAHEPVSCRAASGATRHHCQPAGITAGPDGNIWFTEENGNRIGRITPGGVASRKSPMPAGRRSKPVGDQPSGARDRRRSGSPSRAATGSGESPRPVRSRHPARLSRRARRDHRWRPDGHIWFTEPGQHRIGGVATSRCDYRAYFTGGGASRVTSRRARRAPVVHPERRQRAG